MDNNYILEMKNIRKSFGGVRALKGVDLSVKKGSIHALVGENGAGKSTIMKVLSGAVQSDEGEVLINGNEATILSPTDAIKHKVAIIYQELALVPSLTIAENIFLGRFPISKVGGVINNDSMNKLANEVLGDMEIDLSPDARVQNLPIAYQQMIEIAKATSRDVDILILDEPTGVLATQEIQTLFAIMRRLQAKGVTMIYISHKLDEVFEICDTISVMRDGELIDTIATDKVTKNEVIGMMIGRKLENLFPTKPDKTIGGVKLKIEDLQGKDGEMPFGVSFDVKAGEIVGLSGLIGSGRTEVAKCIFGAVPKQSGTISLNGHELKIHSPADAVKNRFAMINEDRKGEGVILSKSIKQNISITVNDKISKGGIINESSETALAEGMIDKIHIKCLNANIDVGMLSGGNQQKVALAKWFVSEPEVVIFDEPTRGVDVGAKYEIYTLINSMAQEGKGVIIISSEIEEILGLCDRVLVMREGKISADLRGDDISDHTIMSHAV